MKIENGTNLGAVPTSGATGAAGTDASSRRSAVDGGTGASSDSAEVSGRAGQISQALSQDSTSRAAKTDQLRVQVSSGQYNPDAAAVSQSIVKESLTSSATGGGS